MAQSSLQVRPDHLPRQHLAYQPALDGVRAIAVLMVVFFHAGFGFMRGGYLGVSIFFTLSGFLITSLLHAELQRDGTVDFWRFVSRRMRRLLPASLMCLALIALATSIGGFELVPNLRRDLIGAAGNVFNWVRLTGDSSYTDLLGARSDLVSPVEHFWSLAIEEQFYLVWPAVLALIGRTMISRGRTSTGLTRSLLVFIVVAFIVAAVSSPFVAAAVGGDFGYWSTSSRVGELLAGAVVAVAIVRWSVPSWVRHVTGPAVVALVALAVFLPTHSGPAYSGWMAPIGLLSAAMIVGLQVPNVAQRVVSIPPFVALGKISYGVYLYHWPIFLLLRQHGWTLHRPPGFVVALLSTLTVATLSYVLLEHPIHRSAWPPGRTIRVGLAGVVAVIVALAVMPISRGFLEADEQTLSAASAEPVEFLIELRPATSTSNPPIVSTPDSQSQPGPSSVPSTLKPPTTPNSRAIETVATVGPDAPHAAGADDAGGRADGGTPGADFVVDVMLPDVPSRPVRLVTVGDSTAFDVGQALAAWAVAHPAYATSDLFWCRGCGFQLEGTVIDWDASSFLIRNVEVVDVIVPTAIAELQPDVVMLMSTVVDVASRTWTLEEGPLTPSHPTYVERLTTAYFERTQSLLDLGVANVVWVAPPTPTDFATGSHNVFDSSRWVVLRDVIHNVAAMSGPRVTVVDMHGWGVATALIDSAQWRPDGTHFTETSASELVNRWLGPVLIEAALAAPSTE